jgi:hypothetical protein
MPRSQTAMQLKTHGDEMVHREGEILLSADRGVERPYDP